MMDNSFFVPDTECPHLLQQLAVVHIVKERFNIDINDVMTTDVLYHSFRLGNGIFRTVVWPEAIASLEEFCFTDRF